MCLQGFLQLKQRSMGVQRMEDEGIPGISGIQDGLMGQGQQTVAFLQGAFHRDGQYEHLVSAGAAGSLKELIKVGAGNAAEPTRLCADGRYPVCGGDGPVSDVFLFRRRGDDLMLHRICTDEDIRLRAIRLFSFAPGFDLRYNRKRNERGFA